MAKIIHDKKQCIGCGTCASVCPQCFQMDEKSGVVDLKNATVNAGNLEELTVEDAEKIEGLKDAIAFCPVKAIKLEE